MDENEQNKNEQPTEADLFSKYSRMSDEQLAAEYLKLIAKGKQDSVDYQIINAITAQRKFENQNKVLSEIKGGARPQILLPGRDRPISQFARELGEFYSNKKKLFYNVTLQEVVKLELIEIDPKKNIKVWGFKPVSKDNFVTLIEKDFTVGTYIGAREPVFVEESISSSIASAVLESDQFREQLPKLRRIYTVPIPTFIGDELVFPERGYDERLMSWTPENAPDVRLDMPTEDAKALLEDIYSEFAFKNKKVDKYNAIAHLLTRFCRGLYSRETIRTPIFFYIANRERAGKDYCAGIVGIVFEGSAIESPAISTEQGVRDEEFRKEVFSALKIGRSSIHSSNNKGFLNSAELERVSTAEQLMDRLLGTNNIITFPNYLELSLSANQGITYTPDVEKRSIFINLFLDLEDPNSRTFKRPDLHGYVLEHRGDILSALYALVRKWVEKGKPACSKPFSSYPEWMRIVGGIMEAAGWPAPSQNSDPDLIGGDKETKDMKKLFELAAERWGDQPVTKAQIVDEILAPGSDEEPNPFSELFGWLGWYDNLNKAKHGFGLLFKKYEGRILSNIRLEVLQTQKGNAQRNKYRFVKLDTDTDQPKTGQQDLTKPAENKPDTNEGKEEMNGLNGLNGSTNPSNMQNLDIEEYIETPQIPQTPQTLAGNDQNSNKVLDSQPTTPQTPTKPADTPTTTAPASTPTDPTAPDNAHAAAMSSISPHSDTQVQANQQVGSPRPAEPALDNNATQPQQDAPTEPQEQAPTLSKEEIAQRVFISIKLVENEAFWQDSEQQVPNNKIFPTLLQGLSAEEIKTALKSLQWQGFVYETKPNVWKAVRDPHLVDVVAYDDPNMPTICPQCGRHVTKLYWCGIDWCCSDCLAKKKSQNGE